MQNFSPHLLSAYSPGFEKTGVGAYQALNEYAHFSR